MIQQFERLALIGFGLIGGSIARAARLQRLAGKIVTTARSAKTRARINGIVGIRGVERADHRFPHIRKGCSIV